MGKMALLHPNRSSVRRERADVENHGYALQKFGNTASQFSKKNEPRNAWCAPSHPKTHQPSLRPLSSGIRGFDGTRRDGWDELA